MEGTMDEVTEERGGPAVTVGTKNDARKDRGKDGIDDGITTLEERSTATVDTKSNTRIGHEDAGKGRVDDGIRALQGTPAVTADTKSDQTLLRYMEQSDLDLGSHELFPGIRPEVTLYNIVPKLQLGTFGSLSLVSRGWLQAIQSRWVQDSRVRCKSTDTFLVIENNEQILLYSVRDRYYYELPKIPNPHLTKGEIRSRKWTALDGRLYAIGGVTSESESGSREVYVFDLAQQRGWKECASMREPRCDFGCGVLDGKIYVFSGVDPFHPYCRSEVYDPTDNSWSVIFPRGDRRYGFDVAASGEELVLFYGKAYKSKNDDGFLQREWFWEFYHPVKDEWRIVVPPFELGRWGTVFMSKGKLFMMIEDDYNVHIDAYNYDLNIWSELHSSSFDGIAGIKAKSKWYDVIAGDGELFVAVSNPEDGQPDLLLRSDGFGSGKKEILWNIENGSVSLYDFYFLCSVEL